MRKAIGIIGIIGGMPSLIVEASLVPGGRGKGSAPGARCRTCRPPGFSSNPPPSNAATARIMLIEGRASRCCRWRSPRISGRSSVLLGGETSFPVVVRKGRASILWAKQAHVAQLSSDPLQEQAILGVEMGVVLTMPVLQPTGLGTRSRCRTVQIELTGIL